MCKRMKNDGSGFLVLTVYPFLNKIGMNKNAAAGYWHGTAVFCGLTHCFTVVYNETFEQEGAEFTEKKVKEVPFHFI